MTFISDDRNSHGNRVEKNPRTRGADVAGKPLDGGGSEAVS
jgi:hypothetical protein